MFRNTASEPVVPKIMCHSNHLVCLTAIIKYDRCREYRRECCKQERHFVYLGSELAKSTRNCRNEYISLLAWNCGQVRGKDNTSNLICFFETRRRFLLHVPEPYIDKGANSVLEVLPNRPRSYNVT